MAYYLKKRTGSDTVKSFQYKWKQLHFHQKLNGIGCLVAIIGLLLPWISYDKAAANGLQDVTFLIGWIILVLATIQFVFFMLHLFNKKMPRLPAKEHILTFITGLQIVLLSVIAFSIYSSFSRLTSKAEPRFGITIAIIGGLMIAIAGYLHYKEEQAESVKKTFLHLPDEEGQKSDVEKILEKSKTQHKLLTVEESAHAEEKPGTPGQPSKQPPNLSMFEE